jgi:multidrug efflux pump subunit AcrB
MSKKWLGYSILAAGSYACYKNIGSDLLPEMDEGAFIVDYIMPAGSSLEETNRVITHVEKILREIPEVENTSRRTGLQLGLAAEYAQAPETKPGETKKGAPILPDSFHILVVGK